MLGFERRIVNASTIEIISTNDNVDDYQSDWETDIDVDDDGPATKKNNRLTKDYLLNHMNKISNSKNNGYVNGEKSNGLRFNASNGTREQPWKYYTQEDLHFAQLVRIDDHGYLHCEACVDDHERRPCRFSQAYGR